MVFFKYFTPFTYWLLVLLWSFIFLFYIKRLCSRKVHTKLFVTLLTILAIDAFRSLFESAYFGAWYTSLVGFLPQTVHIYLTRPEIVFIPKAINIIAAIIVIFILLYRWIPQEEREKEDLKELIDHQTRRLSDSNENLKQTNGNLQRNEKLLDATQKMAKVGGWEWDVDRQTMFWTNELYRIHDFHQDEFAPGSMEHIEQSLECYEPEDRIVIHEAFKNCIENGEGYDLEFPFHTRKCQGRWIRTIAEPILENGTVIKVIGNILDITDHKQAAEELRKNESLFQRIFEILPIGLWVADKNGNLIKGNPAGIKIWGAEPHVGPEDYGVFTARRLPSMEELAPEDWALAHTISKGVTITDELLEIDTFDGKTKTVLNYTAPVLDSSNNIEGAVIVNLDISERISAENDAVDSKIKLNSLINTIPDLIWLKDEDGKYLSCNPTFERFFGAIESEIVGKTDYDFVDKELADFFTDNDRKALEANSSRINEEWLTFKTDGYHGLFETIKMPVYDPKGKLTGILGVARDITKRHNAEKEKINLEKQLKQSQKMESIGNLAGGIAHEFNNMLAIIMGNNELVMEELPQGSLAHESTEEIRIAGLRARDVVKQLLTFSRQDDAEKKVVDFKLVVEESMKLIRSSTPANIKIEQSLSADTYPVMGNNTQINQLLINLCNNAFDALPEKGGSITIELLNETIDKQQTEHQTKLKPGQYAKLMVSDNGIGMDNDILDRVFEPYFTTKDIGKGTGIGLAVVHGIVERHGGAIIVDSKLGRGTTFTIFLPAHEGLIEQETDERNILPVGDEYILYVDDEPSLAKLGKRLLDSLGYTTESITDPVKALDMVKSDPNKFDLLITDMAMPGMTGDQLIIEILKIRQDIPTIICTGYSANISENEAKEIGASSFVMKPLNKSDLATKVRKVLDGAKNSNLVGS